MNKVSTKISFPVVSFRKIVSPHEKEKAATYVAVLAVKEIPEAIDEWRSINVRDPRLKSGVAKEIHKSLVNSPEMFYFKNRGMTIMADKVSFDNDANTVSLELHDAKIHGLLDGGHTYSVIREYMNELTPEERAQVPAYAKMEFIEGLNDLEEVVSIVEARNTSTQVQEQSLEELRGSYELIKNVLADRDYADSIAYKEFEMTEEGTKKEIDVKEILSYLVCFDIQSFDAEKHPIIAYSGKRAVIQHFKENHQAMELYIPLLPKILELRDHVYASLPQIHNKAGGKFGALTGVGERKSGEKLTFSSEKSEYLIPSAFIYPVLAAFRTLLEQRDGKLSWKADPIAFYETVKEPLTSRIVEQAKQFQNPTKMGKDKLTWRSCYDCVRVAVLERNL